MRVFGEGEVTRGLDGRLRFRAKHGIFEVDLGDGVTEETTSTSFTDLASVHWMTDEEPGRRSTKQRGDI